MSDTMNKTGFSENELALAARGEALLAAGESGKRTPDLIAAEIRAIDVQTQGIVLNAAIEKGRRLDEAKAMLPHGEWGAWLKRELNYSQSTAQNLMKIFREYGSSQQCLFGAEAKSQTFGNLTYTQALRLLAVPEDEREEFAQQHDVASMSTRELDAAIKARDEALTQAQEARNRADGLELLLGEARKRETSLCQRAESAEYAMKQAMEAAREEAEGASIAMAEAQEERDAIARELQELKDRPVEVAVEKVVDQEAVEKARAEAIAEMQEKLDKANQASEKAKEKRKAAEAALEEAKKQLDESQRATAGAVAKAQDMSRERIQELEKRLASSEPDVTEFKVLYTAWQEDYQKMAEVLERIARTDTARAEQLGRAVAAAVENMRTIQKQ